MSYITPVIQPGSDSHSIIAQMNPRRCRDLGALPLPIWGEGWGEGGRIYREIRPPLTRRTSCADLSPAGRGGGCGSARCGRLTERKKPNSVEPLSAGKGARYSAGGAEPDHKPADAERTKLGGDLHHDP